MSDGSYHENPLTDGELLPYVDMDDRLLGVATRREIHARGLIHRAVHVILFDRAGRFALQRRSLTKDRFPGYWDVSVGGHVGVDETYVEAAIRECAEEMGVPDAQPELATIIPPSDVNGWEHLHVFTLKTDGRLAPDPTEVIDVKWTTFQEFFANGSPESATENWLVTPSSEETLRELRKVMMRS